MHLKEVKRYGANPKYRPKAVFDIVRKDLPLDQQALVTMPFVRDTLQNTRTAGREGMNAFDCALKMGKPAADDKLELWPVLGVKGVAPLPGKRSVSPANLPCKPLHGSCLSTSVTG